MMQNPDWRSLPPGCVTHLDAERRQWYYVHLQNDPPRVTFIHPDDETPSSSHNSYFPAQSSTPQQPPSFRQSMYNQFENSSPQQPSRVSPTFANPMPIIQNPSVQQQPSYGNRQSFGQSTSSMQDYTARQQQNPSPPVNNPSSFAMNHARQPSAQSLYGTSVPQTLQTPSDNPRFSIYSTNSHGTTAQEMEFDASILYSSPVSVSPTSAVPSPVAVTPNFQPQRRQMSLDDPEPSNQATTRPRSQSVQVDNPATQRFQPHNVLRRRKMKSAAAVATILQPPTTSQKPNEVPVYTLVAQAPLDTTMKPTTPSFQTQLYTKPVIPPPLPVPSSNSGPLQQITPSRTQSLPPITTSNQQGHFISQYPSSAPTSGSMTIPQQSLSPLRVQSTGGAPAIPSMSYMTSQVPTLMQTTPHSTLGLSNGMMGAPLNPTPLTMNHTPSLMSVSTHPQLDSFSNGTAGLPITSIPPLTYNQLNGLSNGTMTLSGAPLVTPTLIPPQPNSVSNGLLSNTAMAQSSLMMLPQPQQPNMLANGYAQGTSVTQMQSGMIGQSPGVVGQSTNSTAQAPKDNKNKELMKKVGKTFGKAVFRLGTKYVLEQIGVDGAVED